MLATTFQLGIGLLAAATLMITPATAEQTFKAYLGDDTVVQAGTGNPIKVTAFAAVSAIAEATGFAAGLAARWACPS